VKTMRRFQSLNLSLIATMAILAVGCGSGAGGGTGTTGTTTTTGTTSGTSTTADATAKRPVPTAAGNTAKDNTIIIGMVSSLNGDLKPWGDDSAKGGQLAVEEFNKANPNGIGGKKIDFRIADSNSKPEQGKSAAEKLMNDGAIAIVGEVASGITAQIAKAAFEKGVPVVAVGATRTDLTDIGSNVFRVCYTDDFQGPVMAKFAYDELGKRKAALVTDQKQPYSTGLSNSFRDAFTKMGGTVVDEEFYNSGDTQFSGQLTNLKSKQPDVIFMSGYFNETGPLARQARDQGIGKDVPLLGGDGWDSREILTTGGDAILGSFFCNHYNNKETRPAVADFLTKWRAKYGGQDPGTTMGALGYDGVMMTLQALKTAAGPDSKDLTDAIENTTNYPGVSGTITLKGMGGSPHKRALVVQLAKEGQVFKKAYEWTDLYPDAAATTPAPKS
jgi:branched-chain amino acid transport system substrate-binding protein